MRTSLNVALAAALAVLVLLALADVTQGAVISADGPLLQGYISPILHGLTMLACVLCGAMWARSDE